MKNIIFNWGKVKRELKNKIVALFLDFDGTLSTIAKKPNKAFIPKETKQLLNDLFKKSRCRLAIISGRQLKDIKKRVGINGLVYVGNHGFEISGSNVRFESPLSSEYKKILRNIRDELIDSLSVIKGVIIEYKGLSLSVHYRIVDVREVKKVKTVLRKIADKYVLQGKVKVNPGKKVLEIRSPVDWNKGKAVLWLLAKWQLALKNKNIIPVYFGDDVTDEDAFKVLRNRGIGILIGKPNKKSYARYYLKNPEEVKYFLSQLEEILG